MPGAILHKGMQVLCMHGAQAKAATFSPFVKIGGQEMVLLNSVYNVSGCSNPPPPANTGPCMTAKWIKGAAFVNSGGVAALLQDSKAICVPTGTGVTIIVAPPPFVTGS